MFRSWKDFFGALIISWLVFVAFVLFCYTQLKTRQMELNPTLEENTQTDSEIDIFEPSIFYPREIEL